MSRSVPWISKPSPVVIDNIGKVSQLRLYLLRENGPTSFLIKDSNGNPFKVFIGNENKCSCQSHFTCVHILFVMLKVFGIPKENPWVYQKGLIDSEIDQLLSAKGQPWRLPKTHQQASTKQNRTKRRKIKKDDVCPICYEEIYRERRKKSLLIGCECCGNSIHRKCMLIWCRHREKNYEDLTCPLCRNPWSQSKITDLKKRITVKHKPIPPCSHCGNRILKKKEVYQCGICCDYFLCRSCIIRKVHIYHPFRRKHISGNWVNVDREEERKKQKRVSMRRSQNRVVERNQQNNNNNDIHQQISNLEPVAIQIQPTYTEAADNNILSIQYRDIRPEDYGMLSDGLHDISIPNELNQTIIDRVIPDQRYSDVSESCTSDCCTICLQMWDENPIITDSPSSTSTTSVVNLKKLPFCGHVFHSHCICTWIINHKTDCPICHTEVLPSQFSNNHIQQQQQHISSVRRTIRRTKRRINNEEEEEEEIPSSFNIIGQNFNFTREINNNENGVRRRKKRINNRNQGKKSFPKKRERTVPHIADFHGFVLNGNNNNNEEEKTKRERKIKKTGRIIVHQNKKKKKKKKIQEKRIDGLLLVTNHQNQNQSEERKKKSSISRCGMILKLKKKKSMNTKFSGGASSSQKENNLNFLRIENMENKTIIPQQQNRKLKTTGRRSNSAKTLLLPSIRSKKMVFKKKNRRNIRRVGSTDSSLLQLEGNRIQNL